MDAERARRIESTVVQAITRMGAEPIAREIGVSEPTVSRLKNEHLGNFSKLLACAGLKVVPVGMKCYRPEELLAMVTLARARMSQIDHPDQLVWEDE